MAEYSPCELALSDELLVSAPVDLCSQQKGKVAVSKIDHRYPHKECTMLMLSTFTGNDVFSTSIGLHVRSASAN